MIAYTFLYLILIWSISKKKIQIIRNHNYGTIGWAAPELWKGGKRTSAVDVFSLGCVFYYVLAKGRHPFRKIDDLEQCQRNICYGIGQPKLSQLKIEGSRGFKPVLAKSLINFMIQRDYIQKATQGKVGYTASNILD